MKKIIIHLFISLISALFVFARYIHFLWFGSEDYLTQTQNNLISNITILCFGIMMINIYFAYKETKK